MADDDSKPERDYAADLRAVIDAEFHDGDVAVVVAARIVEKLRATDPDLLDGWLAGHAVQLITEVIATIDRAGRARARATSGRADFAAAEKSGDVAGFLETRWVVDEHDTRMRLAKMTGPHLRYGRYTVTKWEKG